jgi:hypothetical protein
MRGTGSKQPAGLVDSGVDGEQGDALDGSSFWLQLLEVRIRCMQATL